MHWQAGLALFCLALTAVRAEVIVDQSAFDTTPSRASQVFTDFPTLSLFQFDDFTTADPWRLTTLTVFGREPAMGADSSLNVSVDAEIRLVPDAAAPVVLSSVSGTQVGTNLVIDFGGQELAPGTYWLTAFVTRPLTGGGQWFWRTASPPVSGQEAWYHNPGGGWGVPVDGDPFIAQPGSNVYDFQRDLAFTLQASPVPEPSTLGLLGLGLIGAAIRRRRAAS